MRVSGWVRRNQSIVIELLQAEDLIL